MLMNTRTRFISRIKTPLWRFYQLYNSMVKAARSVILKRFIPRGSTVDFILEVNY